jgi:DNA-binding transcriptional MerR regulator
MAIVPLVEMPDNLLTEELPQIPERMFFRVGEASRLVGVPPYVLRFWETEFPALAPKKSGRGHRLYRRKDLELFLQIKHLLYEKRFTIEGARQSLKSQRKKPGHKDAGRGSQKDLFGAAPAGIEAIREALLEILKILR